MCYTDYMNQPKTLMEATRYFSDPDVALEFMVKLRWPNGVACPACGCLGAGFLKTRRIWKCRDCGKQFSVKVGTIFEDSPISIDKWLCAIWMISNCKIGVSSYEIHRALGVTQKTAWFMLHRIRLALQNGTVETVKGTIEADETYIGGKAGNMHYAERMARNEIHGSRGSAGKAVVFGMLERGGRVEAKVIKRADQKTAQANLLKHVDGHAKLFTDEHGSYANMSFYFSHSVIHHATQYVKDNVHTNGIENFWSLLKRGLKGTYVSVEPYHLGSYVAEQVFRFNLRKENDATRFMTAASQIVGLRLTYAELTGKVLATGARA